MIALRKLFSLFNVLALLVLVAAALAFNVVQRPAALPELPKLELTEVHPVKMKVYYTDKQVQSIRASTAPSMWPRRRPVPWPRPPRTPGPEAPEATETTFWPLFPLELPRPGCTCAAFTTTWTCLPRTAN